VDVRIAVPEEHVTAPVLNAGLEMNTLLNEKLIRDGDAPMFDDAVKNGLRWKPEPPGLESFDHAAATTRRGWGDCDDLAPHRAASLRVTGEDPLARAVVYQSGPHRWHAIVQRGNGALEDPSQTAGMRVRRGSKAEGIPAAVVGCMATGRGVNGSVRPFTAVRREGVGWVGRTDLPISQKGYAVSVRQRAKSPAAALAGSMRGVCVVGHCAGVGEEEHLDKLWALSGLLRGQSAQKVASIVGVDATKDALQSLADIAPAILEELRAHRRATEAKGHRSAASPFRRSSVSTTKTFDFGRGLDRAMGAKPAPSGVNGFLEDIGHVVTAQNVVRAVQPQAKVSGFFSSLGKLAKGAISAAEGVVSLVPGVGTGISAAMGAGMAILEGGGPLEIAVKTAYGAIPIPPGIRSVTDRVVDAALSLVHTKNIGDASIAALRNTFPAGVPRDVFDTLAHIVLGAVHKQPTHALVKHAPGKPPVVKHIPPPVAPHVAHPVKHLALRIAATPAKGPGYTVKGASVVRA
jgi:hypothetical protein